MTPSEPVLVLVTQAMCIAFVVLVGLALIVFDGCPFVVDHGASAGAYVFAFLALLAAIFLLLRRETFMPSLGAMDFPNAVLRDVPFTSTPRGVTTIPVRLKLSSVKGATKIVYWDDSGVCGVASLDRDGHEATVHLPPRCAKLSLRAVRGERRLGPHVSIAVGL